MILSGFSDMSFLLEPITDNAQTLLQPRLASHEVAADTYGDGYRVGASQSWTREEVAAATQWFIDVAADREPIDARHVWFGGGVAFGRVSPGHGGDVAIDVIVLKQPDGERPIIVDDQHFELGIGPEHDLNYVTIDTTKEQIAAAAAWWQTLLESMSTR